MVDTGENRQITGRANAKEEEEVRASKKRVSEDGDRDGNAYLTF